MQCFALDSPGPPHIAVCAKLPWRTPYLSLRQSIGEIFAANGRPAAGSFSRRAPLSKRRADGAGRPAPIVIMRGLPGPAAGIGRAQMTVIDRCCEGFGPASRRQQKARAAGAGGRNFAYPISPTYTTSVLASRGLFGPGQEFRKARRAGGCSGNFRHLCRRPVSAPGAREGPQLETVGADHRARTRRGQPHRLQQDIHPRIVIVHRQEL